MRRTRPILLLLASALVAGLPALAADPVPASDAEKAAESAALSWLSIVDAGRYGESWDAAASYFRSALTRSQWEAALDKVRRPLGKANARKLRAARYVTELPNAPKGEYVVIQFDTSFASEAGAIETVTPMKERDGTWRVSGYYIK